MEKDRALYADVMVAKHPVLARAAGLYCFWIRCFTFQSLNPRSLKQTQSGRQTRMPRHLILIPTEMERLGLEPMQAAATARGCRVELCGFGPVAAAARAAQLIGEHKPERVLLVGIAGRLDDRLVVGNAYRFDRVACYGIGAGSGSDFVLQRLAGSSGQETRTQRLARPATRSATSFPVRRPAVPAVDRPIFS